MTRTFTRLIAVVLTAMIIAALVVAPALGKTLKVTGTLVLPAGAAAPSPTSIAVITLIDSTPAAGAGNVIGQQRIDGIGDGAISFAVPYEGDTIQPKHAYAVFATIVDDAQSWQNAKGIPVITGGPIEGVNVPVTPVVVGADLITGDITLPVGVAIGPAAVTVAALIKVETGTLAGRQVVPLQDFQATAAGPLSFGFAIPFDAALIDPAASYVVSAAVVDGATTYQSKAGVPAITGGVPADGLTVPIVQTTTTIPVTSPFPSAAPSTAPSASAAPSTSAKPSAAPSNPPTEAPSATPSPTASPTPSPTASPTPSPTASPTPVASASPVPPSGTLTGTLDYPESFKLSAGAVAGVALIEGKGKVSSSPIVATQIIDPAGQAPISFKLTYDPARIDPSAVYTLQAGVFDVDQAWVTAKGIPVITNGAQSNVAVTLTYRPDAAKGEVTGSVTGVGITLAAGATSMSVILDVDSGQSIGVDLTSPASLPAPFAIPFSISDLSSTGTYVVQSEVTSGDQVWANAAGVPVITNGNPLSGVQVVVSEVVQPTPSPSPTPVATSAPTPPAEGGRLDGSTLLLPIIVIVALIAIGGFLLARSKDDEPPAPPSDPTQTPLDPGLAGAAAVASVAVAGTEASTVAPPLDPAETAALLDPAGAGAADADAAADAAGTPAEPSEPTGPDHP